MEQGAKGAGAAGGARFLAPRRVRGAERAERPAAARARGGAARGGRLGGRRGGPRVDGDSHAYPPDARCGLRMTHTRFLAPLLALALLAPLAGAEAFTGTIRQGETDTFVVDRRGDACLQVITTHTVTLTHEPTTDELLLVVSGQGAVRTEEGFAQVSFTTPTSCAFFVVHVIGANVQDEAQYTLDIRSSGGGGGEPA